ncbi:MAG: CinA family nicotinamide mononucleotide deamidase-related protein [Phycisphaeraceae bacterium]|nr:CinA family nicotinamide mononucleotide deamidase-related protein [Phycisphaeraceae bacterium]
MPGEHTACVIVSIGDELTLGQSLDTNSRWLSARLLECGIVTARHVTVPDDAVAVERAVREAAADAPLVISTGGLGPTEDDLTRVALAAALGDELVEDAEALRAIEGWYAARGARMPATNRVQSQRPSGASCLPNPHGTAPGLRARLRGADVFCLPGPPREMGPMFEACVLPALRPPAGRVVRTRVLPTFGYGESRVAELLGDLMRRGRNPLVGTTASVGVVTVRLRYEGGAKEAESALAETERAVRTALGAAVLTPEGDTRERTLAEVVLDLLKERNETLAVAESCTGGLLGAMLTGVSGSSVAFAGGWITYTNAMKHAELGVPDRFVPDAADARAPGAVSEETARAMALGCRERARFVLRGAAGVDHALAITGVAGPDGGTAAKPVGTVWICRASRDGTVDARRFLFRGGRDAVRTWSAMSALGMLRLRLLGVEMELLGEVERGEG